MSHAFAHSCSLSTQAEWVASSFEKFTKILKEADERRVERLKRQVRTRVCVCGWVGGRGNQRGHV